MMATTTTGKHMHTKRKVRTKRTPSQPSHSTGEMPLSNGRPNKFSPDAVGTKEIENDDSCWSCHHGGELLCCDSCPRVFHHACCQPELVSYSSPNGFLCAVCKEMQRPSVQSNPHMCEILLHIIEKMARLVENTLQSPEMKEKFPATRHVKHPVTINSLRQAVLSGALSEPRHLLRETEWIRHNCVSTEEESVVVQTAHNAVETCRAQVAAAESCTECYWFNIQEPLSSFRKPCARNHKLVWARDGEWVTDNCWWPAKVMKAVSSFHVELHFFGSHDRKIVSLQMTCELEDVPCPSTVTRRSNALFQLALEELLAYVSHNNRFRGIKQLLQARHQHLDTARESMQRSPPSPAQCMHTTGKEPVMFIPHRLGTVSPVTVNFGRDIAHVRRSSECAGISSVAKGGLSPTGERYSTPVSDSNGHKYFKSLPMDCQIVERVQPTTDHNWSRHTDTGQKTSEEKTETILHLHSPPPKLPEKHIAFGSVNSSASDSGHSASTESGKNTNAGVEGLRKSEKAQLECAPFPKTLVGVAPEKRRRVISAEDSSEGRAKRTNSPLLQMQLMNRITPRLPQSALTANLNSCPVVDQRQPHSWHVHSNTSSPECSSSSHSRVRSVGVQTDFGLAPCSNCANIRQSVSQFIRKLFVEVQQFADQFAANSEQKPLTASPNCSPLSEKDKLYPTVKKAVRHCTICGNEGMYVCCQGISYCSEECQQRHWPEHMQHCTFYSSQTLVQLPEQNATIIQPGSAIVQPGSTIVQPGSSIVQAGSTIVQAGSTIVQPGSTIVQPGSTIVHPGSVQPAKSRDQNSQLLQQLHKGAEVPSRVVTANQNTPIQSQGVNPVQHTSPHYPTVHSTGQPVMIIRSTPTTWHHIAHQ